VNRMSADFITQDELIEELNGLMAEELEASLRYFALSIMVVQPTEAFSELLREVVGETMEHAGWVAKEIRELGGEPKINVKLSSTAVPMTTEEAVAEILIVETAALECYKDLLGRCSHFDESSGVKRFLAKQVEEEEHHVSEFRDLCHGLGIDPDA
jgi:bacterioferritin (cytochrome b1)